jgi:hypothetical protein
VLEDDRPNEPDEAYPEPDPEADLENPEEDLTSVPEPPKPPEPMPESEVPDDLLKSFWALVLLANVALFGLTVGPMALYFYPDPRLGTALLAVGAFAALAGARRFREVQRTQDTEE